MCRACKAENCEWQDEWFCAGMEIEFWKMAGKEPPPELVELDRQLSERRRKAPAENQMTLFEVLG